MLLWRREMKHDDDDVHIAVSSLEERGNSTPN
jgi:hypothetical protein